MNEASVGSPYYIFMDGGDNMYVLRRTGKYETDLSEAMTFADKLDAIIYVKKHGYQSIATKRLKRKYTCDTLLVKC